MCGYVLLGYLTLFSDLLILYLSRLETASNRNRHVLLLVTPNPKCRHSNIRLHKLRNSWHHSFAFLTSKLSIANLQYSKWLNYFISSHILTKYNLMLRWNTIIIHGCIDKFLHLDSFSVQIDICLEIQQNYPSHELHGLYNLNIVIPPLDL